MPFVRSAAPPLTLEDIFRPVPAPGGNPLRSHSSGPSSMNALSPSGTGKPLEEDPVPANPHVTLAPEDPFADFFTPPPIHSQTRVANSPAHDKPRASPRPASRAADPFADFLSAASAKGRIPLGHGLPSRTVRKRPPATLQTVFTKFGITASSDPASLQQAMETHAGCLAFLNHVHDDLPYLRGYAVTKMDEAGRNLRDLLEALSKSEKKIFLLMAEDKPAMTQIFRALARKYHTDRENPRHADAAPDKDTFSSITSSWNHLKALHDWG